MAAGLTSVVSPASTLTWGKPNANAAKIATQNGDATKVMLYGYDTDVAMSSIAAPMRRVGFFLFDTNGNTLTANGNALFDAAIKWLGGTTITPNVTALSPTLGPVGTAVTVSGVNFGATQGTSTITFNGRPATVTSWAMTRIVATVPVYATTGTVAVKVNGVAGSGLIFAVGVTDSDGDGLPDSWETTYFGNLTQGAAGDPDGDGLTNLQEFQLGRNPTKGAIADNGINVNLKVYTPLANP